MSTTDSRAAFEAWAITEGLISDSHGIRFVNSMCEVARKAFNAGIAHTEAAKATGTAGEPEPCGGCGNSDPDKRCIGCGHPFLAARQPAPVVAVKTWRERVAESPYPEADGTMRQIQRTDAMRDEIAELRAALAATAAPVLSDEQISKMARYLSDFSSAQCGVDKDDAWAIYGNDEIELVRAAFAATRSQP